MTFSEEHTKHFIYLLRRVFLRSSLWIELSYCFLSHVHLYILSFHLKQQHCFAQLHLIMTNPFTFFSFFFSILRLTFHSSSKEYYSSNCKHIQCFIYSSQHTLSFQLIYYFSTVCALCFYHLSLCISNPFLCFWQFCLLLLSPTKIYHTK